MAELTCGLTIKQYDLFLQKIAQNADEIAEEVNRRTVKDAYNKAQSICKSAVDSFYNEYTPHLYNRKKSLYDAYDIGIRNGSQLVFTLGHELMNASHRVSSEYIYDTMFKEGWHGGADKGDGHPSPGKHYWRTPPTARMMYVEKYDETYYVRPWAFWFNRPAPRGTAPYETIKRRWNMFIDGEYKQKQIKVLREIIRKYIQEVL